METFDRRYEEQVAEQIGRAETQADAFELLVARWRPQRLWQRELLHTEGAPEDLCNAKYEPIEDGRALFLIVCTTIEDYAADGQTPLDRRDLADDARDRALWMIARALRMSAMWLSELPVIAVHQQQQLAPGDVAVYASALQTVPRAPVLDALLAELGDRVTVVEQEWPWVAEHSRRRQPILISRLDELPAWAMNEHCPLFPYSRLDPSSPSWEREWSRRISRHRSSLNADSLQSRHPRFESGAASIPMTSANTTRGNTRRIWRRSSGVAGTFGRDPDRNPGDGLGVRR